MLSERVPLTDAAPVLRALAGAYGWEISHHDFLRHPHPLHLVV